MATTATDLDAVARRIRRHILEMIGKAGSGHPGGSLSAADIVTALYFRVLRHRPSDPADISTPFVSRQSVWP